MISQIIVCIKFGVQKQHVAKETPKGSQEGRRQAYTVGRRQAYTVGRRQAYTVGRRQAYTVDSFTFQSKRAPSQMNLHDSTLGILLDFRGRHFA